MRTAVLFIMLGFGLPFAFGEGQPQNVDPDAETKVSISVFDLIKRDGKTPMSPASGLQRKYVEAVLDLIRRHRDDILNVREGKFKNIRAVRFEHQGERGGEGFFRSAGDERCGELPENSSFRFALSETQSGP